LSRGVLWVTVFVSVACCQVEVSATCWSFVQRSPMVYCLCECCVLSSRGLCDVLILCPEESCGCVSCECCVFLLKFSATGWSFVQLSPMGDCLCECCVLPARALCDGLIPRPEQSYGYLLWMMCGVRYRSLRRADPPYRGILQSVCVCVCVLVQQ
jgi:hypothetical protein